MTHSTVICRHFVFIIFPCTGVAKQRKRKTERKQKRKDIFILTEFKGKKLKELQKSISTEEKKSHK